MTAGEFKTRGIEVLDGWFGPRKLITLNPATTRFIEDGWEITLHAQWDDGGAVCGERVDDTAQPTNPLRAITCLLPPGHECKHIPCDFAMVAHKMRFDSVSIRRIG